MASNRVNIQVGFTVDRTGLQQLNSALNGAASELSKLNEYADLSPQLAKSAHTIEKLRSILGSTFNQDLGSLNVARFNEQLKLSGMTLSTIKADLTQMGGTGATAYNKLAQSILGANLQLKQSSQLLDSVFTSFKNTFTWGLTSGFFNSFTNGLARSIDFAKNLNSTLNDIRIVTDKSADSMERFAETAIKNSQRLGASTLNYTKGILLQYQQGLSDAEAQARADVIVKAANVTGQTGDEVSEQLTSVWNGYKVTAEETELYIDKLAAVAATTAADLEELSVGMSKTAAAANMMGVDIDQLSAMIATIISVTREAPETVGNAIKTILARMSDLKANGADEFGVTLGEVTKQMEQFGIKVLDQNNDLRNMGDVINEIAAKWGNWTKAQRDAAAQAMAGKRQYSQFIALFDNWDAYTQTLETSANAMGTLQHQQDIYMESTPAKIKELQGAWDAVSNSLIKAEQVNGIYDIIIKVVKYLNTFISSFGGGLQSIGSLGLIVANVFSKNITNAINNLISRQEVAKQNFDALVMKQQALTLKSASGESLTAEEKGVQANLDIQLKYAQQIFDLRNAMSTETYNELTQLQRSLGLETEKMTVLSNQKTTAAATAEVQKQVDAILQGQIQAYGDAHATQLKGKDAALEVASILNTIRDDMLKFDMSAEDLNASLVKNEKTLNSVKQDTAELPDHAERLLTRMRALIAEGKTVQQIQAIIKRDANTSIEQVQTILKRHNQDIAALEAALANQDAFGASLQKSQYYALELSKRLKNVAEQAQRGRVIITSLSSVGTMFTAWGTAATSIESFFNMLDQGKVSVSGVLGILSSLGMMLGQLHTSIKRVNEITAAAKAGQELLNKAREEGVTVGRLAYEQAMLEQAMLITNDEQRAKELVAIDRTIAKKVQEGTITDENTLAEEINTQARQRNLGQLSLTEQQFVRQSVATDAATGAVTLNTRAIELQTEAQRRFNIEALKSPYAWIMIAITALIALITTINKLWEKSCEAMKEEARELSEVAKAQTETAKTVAELSDKYEDLYQQYKAGTLAKAEFAKQTNNLLADLAKEGVVISTLATDYEDLQDKIKRAKEEAAQKAHTSQVKATEKTKEAAQRANKKGPLGIFGDVADSTDSPLPDAKTIKIAQEYQTEFDQIVNDIKDNSGYVNVSLDDTGAKIVRTIRGLERLREIAIASGHDAEEEGIKDWTQIIDTFTHLAEWDDIVAGVDANLQTLLQTIQVGGAKTEAEFNTMITNLRSKLEEGVEEGNLAIQNSEIEDTIAQYLGTIDSAFARDWVKNWDIDKQLDGVDDDIKDVIKNFEDLRAVAETLKLKVTLENMQPDEVQAYLENVSEVLSAQAASQGGITIPLEVQTEINDKLRKDKDISKEEYETLVNSSPTGQGTEILGSMEDFNNATYGEQRKRLTELAELSRQYYQQVIQDQERLRESSQKLQLQDTEQYQNLTAQQDTAIKELGFLESKQKEYEQLRAQGASELEIALAAARDNIDLNHLSADIDSAKEKVKELTEEVNALDGEQFEVELDIEQVGLNEIETHFGQIISQAEEMKAAAETIGEGWKVAADDVATFASMFPDIISQLEEVQWLSDGSIQLTQQQVDAVLAGQQAEIQGEKQVFLEKINQKMLQLEAERKFQEEKLAAYEAYLNAEVKDDATAETLKQSIQQATFSYIDTLQDNQLISNATAERTKSVNAKNSGEAVSKTLISLNAMVMKLHENFVNAFKLDGAVSDLPGFSGAVAETDSGGGGKDSNSGDPRQARAKRKLRQQEKDLNKDLTQYVEQQADVTQKRIDEIDKQIADLGIWKSKVLSSSAGADTAASNARAGRGGRYDGSGSGGGGGGGGGSEEKREEELKKLEDEFDRFWELKKAIESTDKALDELAKDQENLYSWELIKSLDKTNELLDEQRQNYEKLLEAQEAEAAELRGTLAGQGVAFDATGGIINYAEATAKALAIYNEAIAKYNANLIDETTLETYQRQYEAFKEALERYEALFYNEMKDTQEKLEDIERQKNANKLKKWETQLELKLDTKQLKRDWKAFLKEINTDFKSVFRDILSESSSLVGQAKTYLGKNGTINTDITATHDVEKDIDRMRSGKKSKLGFESISQAQDKLKKLNEQLQSDAQELYDLWQEAWDAYLEGIDQVSDRFEHLHSQLERVTDTLEYLQERAELLNGYLNRRGVSAIDQRIALLKQQSNALDTSVRMYVDERDMWQKLFEEKVGENNWIDASEWDEDTKKYYDNMVAAEQKVNDKVLERLKLVQEIKEIQIEQAKNQYYQDIYGTDKDLYMMRWEDARTQAQERYLDGVEKAYEITKLEHQLQQDMADLSLEAQEKLAQFRDSELKALAEKKKLTQYDVEAAQARYNIALAEAQLEEAKNAKTGMKVVRNEEGNWSYQYVADEEDMASKQQNYLDKLYELRELAMQTSLEMDELRDKVFAQYQERIDQLMALAESEPERTEEINAEIERLREELANELAYIDDTYNAAAEDADLSSLALSLAIYDEQGEAAADLANQQSEFFDIARENGITSYGDLSKFVKEEATPEMQQSIKDMAKNTYDDAENKLNAMRDQINKQVIENPNSMANIFDKYYNSLLDANEEYDKAVDETADSAQQNFLDVSDTIDWARDATEELEQATESLSDSGYENIKQLEEAANELEEAWHQVADAIREAIALLMEYLQVRAEAEGESAPSAPKTSAPSAPEMVRETNNSGSKSSGSGGGGGGSSSAGMSNTTETYPWTVSYHDNHDNLQTRSFDTEKEMSRWTHHHLSTQSAHRHNTTITIQDPTGKNTEWSRGLNPYGFDSGGYTGAWGKSGKLAMLHEKELVLNKSDTANILAAVKTMRALSSGLTSSLTDYISNGISTLIPKDSNKYISNNKEEGTVAAQNTFNITAEFPNANSVAEIQEAILGLPNLASQYIHSNSNIRSKGQKVYAS